MNFNILPTCHDKRPCFAKAGTFCTALRETYPAGTPCPFRKIYVENIKADGVERKPKGGRGRHEAD